MKDPERASTSTDTRLLLAGYMLDVGAQSLHDANGQVIRLRPQAWAVLRHLALNPGRVVTKDELFDAVWPGIVVTDGSLVQAIVDVRRALGDAGPRVLKTVPRRGYMMVAAALPEPGGLGDTPAAGSSLRVAPPSIAVLAFTDPDGDPAGELLAHGVAQDIVLELGRNVDLRIVSHHSSFRLSNQGLAMAEIGTRLRARYLVTGTVRRDGEQLRIGVEVIDCRDEHIVWASRYEAGSARVLAQRDEMVTRIAAAVRSKLQSVEHRRSLARPPNSMDVYSLTTRADALGAQFHGDATREARALLEQALAIDGQYAAAWASLGSLNSIDSVFRLSGEWGWRRLPECVTQLQRAIALDPVQPRAFRALSFTYAAQRNFGDALAAAQRGVVLAPNDADQLTFLAKAQLEIGLVDAALDTVRRALDLYPIVPPWMHHVHALVLWGHGELIDALQAANACLAEMPQYWPARLVRVYSLAELGRVVDARRDATVLLELVPRMTARRVADEFADEFADAAPALRERAYAAALAAGLPGTPPPTVAA